jgi:hypothetical protein
MIANHFNRITEAMSRAGELIRIIQVQNERAHPGYYTAQTAPDEAATLLRDEAITELYYHLAALREIMGLRR